MVYSNSYQSTKQVRYVSIDTEQLHISTDMRSFQAEHVHETVDSLPIYIFVF